MTSLAGSFSRTDDIAEVVLTVRGMTCGSCVQHVRAALEGVAGVLSAEVDLPRSRARVRYALGVTEIAQLREAIGRAGYEALDQDESAGTAAPAEAESTAWARWFWPGFVGALGAVLLATLYLTVVTVAQGWSHALELVTGDWYFVGAIAVGFGVQVGLFVHMRRLRKAHATRSSTALTGAGTGTSTVAMLACCAHHATDVLPLIGLSGAAVFLTDYRVPFMVLGIATNLVGIVIMLRVLRKHARQVCVT